MSRVASGILPTITSVEMHIGELLHGVGLRLRISKRDASNANRADIKMLIAEIRNRNDFLVIAQTCALRALNNYCTIWGLGRCPYGSILRTCRVYDARHFKKLEQYVARVSLPGIDSSPIVKSGTAQ